LNKQKITSLTSESAFKLTCASRRYDRFQLKWN